MSLATDAWSDAMLGMDFEAVTWDTVLSLAENETPEGLTLDYKSELPKGTRDGKKDFLADVSALANTQGGWLIYGVDEDEGVPTKVLGVPGSDMDSTILSLENLLRDGVQPRINGVRLKAVRAPDGTTVMVLWVPRSWAGPHMVTLGKGSRFFARNSGGNYQLDVQQLRAAFLQSERLALSLREFRAERLSRILAGETPVPLATVGCVALHVVPASSLVTRQVFDVRGFEKSEARLWPLGAGGCNYRYNVDGWLTYSENHTAHNEPRRCFAYLQCFRTGAIEAVNATAVQARKAGGQKLISAVWLEDKVAQCVREALVALNGIGASPPVFVCVTVTGAKGARLATGEPWGGEEVDRDVLLLPEVAFEDFRDINWTMIRAALRPVFDALWQAAGRSRSFSYQEDGGWAG